MINQIYVRMDADNIGNKIELHLLNEDFKKAQLIHNNVQSAMLKIRDRITKEGGVIIMFGCDDILFSIVETDYSLVMIEGVKNMFKSITNNTLSVGVGRKPLEALQNLRRAKLLGKNTIVGAI